METREQSRIVIDPQTVITTVFLAKLMGGDHNNPHGYNEEQEDMSYYERLEKVEKSIEVIKSDYVTKSFLTDKLSSHLKFILPIVLSVAAGGYALLWDTQKDIRSLDTKIAKVEQHLDDIDGKFKEIDYKFKEIDKRLENVDNKINLLDQKLDKVLDTLSQSK